MKHEELAFFNHQLAGMLRSGLPLEGALKELTRELNSGPLKKEISLLEKDLSEGRSLAEAIQDRQFPALYVRMIAIGARSGQLEPVLILVADHYHRLSLAWSQFKGALFYPIITLIAAFFLSLFLAYTLASIPETFLTVSQQAFGFSHSSTTGSGTPLSIRFLPLLPPIVLGSALAGLLIAVTVPVIRRRISWRIPGFRDASLAHTAASCSVLLKSGLTLDDALTLVRDLEGDRTTRADLSRWIEQLAQGQSSFGAVARSSASFPPLFIWLVASSGEAIGEGFAKAAQLYQRRAEYRADLLTNAAMPVSILFVGGLILLSVFPSVRFLTQILSGIDMLGG